MYKNRKIIISTILIFNLWPVLSLYAGNLLSSVYNRPNPFSPLKEETEIIYTLSKDAGVEIWIFSLIGNLVRKYSFASGEEGGKSGLNTIKWDGRNGEERVVADGVYLAVITAGGETKIRKIGVLK